MSSDKENVKMKGSKPPPPVPPRPSKTLIKEALAKTKQAYGTYITSVPRSPNDEKPPTRQAPAVPGTNDRLILSGNDSFNNNIYKQTSKVNNVCERHTQFTNYSTRPVIYQSENCKKRLFDLEVTKKSDTEINRTNNKNSTQLINEVRISESDTNNYIKKVSSSESLLPSALKIKQTSRIKKELNEEECGINNNIVNSKKTDADFDKRNNDSEFGIRIAPDDEISSSISKESASPDCNKNNNTLDQNWDDELNNRNHVNTLIDEMFASVLEVNLSSSTSASSSTESIIKESEHKCNITLSNDNNNSNSDDENLTIIIVNENTPNKSIPEPNKTETTKLAPERERKVTFNDLHNHEYLINELQNMKNHEDNILKRQRLTSLNREDDSISFQDDDKIQTNDWYGVNEGKKVRMSSCHIQIDDSCVGSIGEQRIKNMSRVYGLPPLPKSLSGFKFAEVTRHPERSDSIRSNESSQMGYFSSEEISTTEEDSTKEKISLNRQLAILRREMDSLREQDISLLSKLWFLNESIQDFRQMLQEQEEKLNLTLSASPTPSSVDDEEFYVISTSTC